MKIIDEELELEENQYYQITCLLSEKKDVGKWLAKVRVIRKDTGEYINAGFTVFDHEKKAVVKSVIKRAKESLLPELEVIGEPSNWNSDIRRVLMCCKKLHSEIVKFGSYSAETIFSKSDEDKYWAKYAIFWKSLSKESISLSKKIEKLSAKERIDLLILPEDAIEEPSDAWSLEEIDLRIMIFDFFATPTNQEKEESDFQKKRLANRFKELGWDEIN